VRLSFVTLSVTFIVVVKDTISAANFPAVVAATTRFWLSMM
jgi:hypothetical protein